MTEVAIGHGANGADRDAHTATRAKRLAEIFTKGGADRGLDRAQGGFDRGDADHLVANARAAVAHDAAIPLVIDQIAEMDVRFRHLGAAVRIGIDVVQIGVVLQVALAGLVAGGTVERVVDQKHLQNELAGVDTGVVVRDDFHILTEQRGAGLDQTTALAEDVYGANATRAPRAEFRLKAQIGDVDPRHPGGFEDRRSFGNGHLLPVDLAGDHLGFGARHHRAGVGLHLPDACRRGTWRSRTKPVQPTLTRRYWGQRRTDTGRSAASRAAWIVP